MNEFIELIRTTRAMRRFTGEPVTDEEILACIRAAVQAPSGGNIQPWRFVAVTDPAAKKAVGDIYFRAYDRYERSLLASVGSFRSNGDRLAFERTARASRELAEHFGDVPAMVLVCMPRIDLTLSDDEGPMDIGTTHASVYPAVQNLMLAARSMGIGSVLTTVYRIYQDEVRAATGVPGNYEIVALVPMGRPRGKFGVAARRPAEAVTYWNQWGEKR